VKTTFCNLLIVHLFFLMGRSSAISLRRREWTVNKGNWPKTVQHDATHRPRGRVPHKPTTHAPKQQEMMLNNNLSRSRRSDIQTSATHTHRSQDRVPARPMTLSPKRPKSTPTKRRKSPEPPLRPPHRTRLADEVDAERHGLKRADETPDLQRRRPQGGSDDDAADARFDQGRILDFHPKSPRHKRRGR
jgi:hypothetical protein